MKQLHITPGDFAWYYKTFNNLYQTHTNILFQNIDTITFDDSRFNKAAFYTAIGTGKLDEVDELLHKYFPYIICNWESTSLRMHKDRIRSSIHTMTLFLQQNSLPEDLINYIRNITLTVLQRISLEYDANFFHYLIIRECTIFAQNRGNLTNYSEETKSCILYMYQSNMKKKTIGDLASYVGITERHLSNLFHKELSMSIPSYFHLNRIYYSKLFLTFTDCSPAEIAEIFNYTDAAYFCKQFKQVTTLSPKEYRTQYLLERKAFSLN